MKHKGLIISDIHVGAFDIEKQYNEYQVAFIDYIKNLNKLDFIIITGDYFHKKFFLNDKESLYAYKMMQELIDVCKDMHTKIRIVYGTESHECNQYDILNVLDLYTDIKVIKTVTDEYLFDDLHILYIPEEYMTDKYEYYKDYLYSNNVYDYIFGHGVIREVMKDAVAHMKASSDNKRKKVPIFTSEELGSICNGQVYFGHYHINYNIDDKVISVGSFSRWKFGEDAPKGFYELNVDTSKFKYDFKFIENNITDTYKTIMFGYNSDIFSDPGIMYKELNKVDKLIEADVFDNVRFDFNIPTTIESPESIINYIKERYKYNNNIKVLFTNGYIKSRKDKDNETLKENDKYEFIFDKSLDIPTKVSQFISIEYNKNIPIGVIDRYLNADINEILQDDIL